ncbi:unnamed protein product [Hyaloperonospora brassicae]|uniref:Uncharacterized protein n=1 Tax=Hyaloperonospora brassicae TaxID=162125 RepID=A0AAV0TSK3_HYABA|nr:unnamed protein product [Hyaloperonospora brassicae]
MDYVWNQFQAAYQRKGFSVMDEGAGKLSQPLMTSNSEDDESEDDDTQELNGLLPRAALPKRVDEAAATRRKKRRRKDDEDLGEVAAVRLAPLLLLRSVSKATVSLSTAWSLLRLHAHRKSSGYTSRSLLPTSAATRPTALAPETDAASDRALAVLAVVTLGVCGLLLLGVYIHTT